MHRPCRQGRIDRPPQCLELRKQPAQQQMATYAIGTLMRDKGLWTLPFRTMGSIGLLYVVIQGTLLHTWNISIQDALNGLALTMAILLGAVCAYFLGKLVMKREWVAAVMTLTPFIVGFGLLLANAKKTG